MKKLRVFYRDDMDNDCEWDAGPYEPDKAKAVAEQLALMGCHSFRYVPERKAA